MGSSLKYGIDLGTTNSAIAGFNKGQVQIFRNPLNQKDTLPSVIAFRQERILVGEKALEYMQRDPLQVVGSFKRKMGTAETYNIPSRPEVLTPVELSSYVLRELKQFIPAGESLDAAVITIPASFDTAQAQATLEAAKLAGIHQAELLQEPIAASLAYANAGHDEEFIQGKWLVYDLGGGTYDVALVEIEDGEMKVRDHEGNNFLGGTDIDRDIVEQVLIPAMEESGKFENLKTQMRSDKGKYQHLYQILLYKAEEAKIQLTTRGVAEIEFQTEDKNGQPYDGFVLLKRKQLDKIVEPYFKQTMENILQLLGRNHLSSTDLRYVLLVGGSTYLAYIREQLAEQLGVKVNTQIDPTTAVAVGAAYYAGTQLKELSIQAPEGAESSIQVKLAYQKNTQEEEEFFIARFSGKIDGLSYRITREDGGFDTGWRIVSEEIQEELPLVKGEYNLFQLQIVDAQSNLVEVAIPEIGIMQGQYQVLGQPLPHDICLEIDDPDNERTALELVFEKNALLPLQKTIVKQVSRTIAKGSDERLLINILEGPGNASPAANQLIGQICVSGKDLERDLIQSSDVEIKLEMSASRELRVAAYLMMSDQEFEDVFLPTQRQVDIPYLINEMELLLRNLRTEVQDAELEGNYQTAQELIDLEYNLLSIIDQAQGLAPGDTTDQKFQLEDSKRKLAQRVDELTKDKHIIRIKNKYFQTKRNIEFVLSSYEPTESDKETYQNILSQEKAYLASNSVLTIQGVIDRINQLNAKIVWKSPRYLIEVFNDLAEGRYGKYTRPDQARVCIDQGWQAINNKNYQDLRAAINQLWELLPREKRPANHFGYGTGLR